MTISALGSSSSMSALTQTSGTQRPKGPPADTFENTAQLLGLSTDDLKTQLDSGETLSSLATAKGVSDDDLLASVKQDLKTHKPDGAPDLSDDQLTQMASGIASGRPPGGMRKAPGTSASDTSQTLQTLADALGTTSDDLLQKLQSGSNLSSLFGQSGSATWSQSGTATSGLSLDVYA
jgi:outer membrane receptor protein involved in Fe transport